MKKLLLLGLILAICILAFPEGVLADEAIVNANVVEFTNFAATGNPALWDLYYAPVTGVTQSASAPINTFTDGLSSVSVISNNPWHITVTGENGGKLMPYSSGGYTGTALTNAIHIVNGSTDVTVSNTAQNLVPSTARTAGWSSKYDYVQTLAAADDPRNDYRQVLTLTFVVEV
jgi:hypothetical protein